MKKAVITKINRVKANGIVLVSLNGMRADLTDCIEINTNEIESWYGIDSNGYSVAFSIEAGQAIEYKELHTVTRQLEGVKFINNH